MAAIQGFVDGSFENHGFLFKTEESDEYVALKAEEKTYKDYDSAYRLFKGEDEESEADRPLLVIHYTLPVIATDDSQSKTEKSKPEAMKSEPQAKSPAAVSVSSGSTIAAMAIASALSHYF